MFILGRGGGQVVSVLVFYSDDPLKPKCFLFLCLKRTKINKKRPVLAHLKNKYLHHGIK